MAIAIGTEWQEARQWLIDAHVIPVGHPVTKPSAQLTEFTQSLTDGVFLCMVLNRLHPNAVPHFHPKAKLQFKCVQNINAFLMSIHRVFDLAEEHTFEYADLTDMSDFGRVVRCLSALSHTPAAVSSGLRPFPSAPSDPNYTEEDIYGNLEKIAMQTRSYSSNRPPLPPTGGADSVEDTTIYDTVPDQTADEEDIYGSLVSSYAGKGKTQQGSGFGGLPEKMGYVVAEIVETERNYLEALNLLTQHYLEPMSHKLDAETCKTVFLNIPDLVIIHQKFCDSLNVQLASSTKQFSRCFIESADDFVQYAFYCAGLSEAQSRVQELMDKPATSQLLESCKKASKQKFYLKELLSVPMQRMLKYPLLLRELIKQGKKCDWHECLQLEMAANHIQDVAKSVNEVKRDSERMQVTKDIMSSLVEYRGENLTTYGRSLFFGDIKLKSLEDTRPKPRYGFLFDRALLVCRTKNDKFIVKSVLNLEDYRVEDLPAPTSKAKFTSGFQMQGNGAAVPSCVVYAKTINDKQEWLQLVQKAITNVSPPNADKGNHRFEQYTTDDMTTRCTVCTRLLWGRVLQGYRCSVCQAAVVHQDCLVNVSDICGRRTSVSAASNKLPPPRVLPASPRVHSCRSIRPYNGVPPPPPSGLRPIIFGIGEDIKVSSNNGEWWEGTLVKTNAHGVFPSAYVKLKEERRQPLAYEETTIKPPVNPPGRTVGSVPLPSARRSILQGYTWFVGKMSRAEAELHLMYSNDGVYLIRESEARPGDYALSIKYEQPKHIRVNQRDSNYFLSQTRVFPSIMGLVEYYQGNTLSASFPGLDTKLLVPFNETTSYCCANYKFVRRNEEELTIEEQQEVTILSKETPKPKWWYGYNDAHKSYGLFPSNYVTELGHR